MDIYKKIKRLLSIGPNSTDNGVLGPTYLEGWTEHISYPNNLQKNEWRRKLISPSGNTWFCVKYYGVFHKKDNNLIMGIDDLPVIVVAVDAQNGQEVLLFDEAMHGYNSMFNKEYNKLELGKRQMGNTYKDKSGNELFEVDISTINHIDYAEEFYEESEVSGFLEGESGKRYTLEEAQRNGYSYWGIVLRNAEGKTSRVYSGELD